MGIIAMLLGGFVGGFVFTNLLGWILDKAIFGRLVANRDRAIIISSLLGGGAYFIFIGMSAEAYEGMVEVNTARIVGIYLALNLRRRKHALPKNTAK